MNHKIIKLIKRSELNKKNAIFTMCIINSHYVIGALIMGFTHRKMLVNAGIKDKTDLVIMCDESIYDTYNELLSLPIFFDRIIKINLRIFPDSPSYNYAKAKYSSWIGASLNKWQAMNYDEYNMIMCVDIALLPSDSKIYDLFNINAPGLFIREKLNPMNYQCTDGYVIKNINNNNLSYDEYLADADTYGTIHGFIGIIKPDKQLYEKYVQMTDQIYKSGIYSIFKSGPDETSLFYFYLSLGHQIYNICHENATIPWDEPFLINIAKGYQFTAMYKPWTKPKILCWPEEALWRDIYDILIKQVIKFNPNSYLLLNQLFKQTLITTYHRYMDSDKRTQIKNYNDKYINMYKSEFDKLRYIKNSDDLFDALIIIDSKIHLKFYGKLKTEKLISLII